MDNYLKIIEQLKSERISIKREIWTNCTTSINELLDKYKQVKSDIVYYQILQERINKILKLKNKYDNKLGS